jgi:hypothetical protein
MTKLRQQLTVLIGIISIVGLAQCGAGNSNSAHTVLKILSQQPVVINAPLTLTLPIPPNSPLGTVPTQEQIAANWFLYYMEIDNNSTEELTIVNADFNLSGVDDNDQFQTATATLNLTDTCVPATNATITSRTYVAVLQPGSVYTHLSDPTGCDPTTAIGGQPFEGWYIDSLATGVTSWQVLVAPIGWFTDLSTGEPNERLLLQSEFVTQ